MTFASSRQAACRSLVIAFGILLIAVSAQAYTITIEGSALSLRYHVVRVSAPSQGIGVFKDDVTLDLIAGQYTLANGSIHNFEVGADGLITGLDPNGPFTGAGTAVLGFDPSKVAQISVEGSPLSLHYSVGDHALAGYDPAFLR